MSIYAVGGLSQNYYKPAFGQRPANFPGLIRPEIEVIDFHKRYPNGPGLYDPEARKRAEARKQNLIATAIGLGVATALAVIFRKPLGKTVAKVAAMVSPYLTKAKNFVKPLFTKVKTFVAPVVTKVTTFVSPLVTKAKSAVTAVTQYVANLFSKVKP